ncbi:WD-repeat-containing protein [Vararia minispora EC-137]|uniref:WD-repeat-containing protein n=1 Tax=Vararia minispora EC-137 TaxID=1314806 RepID=A0ACB8QWK4_9AGAM|nr:WD-repeat-containing protein [Vararia minispora EC-137]
MVQSYLRHGPTQAFGLVCSPSSNSIYDGKFAYVPALEDVLVWDVKKGEMIAMWHETGHRAEVTCIARSSRNDIFAVGYADGSIRLWSASAQSVVATFNGHKSAVTALAFDGTGTRLASGSQDTNLILWDVVGEAGLFRLRGHRDQITAIHFLSGPASNSPSTSAVTNAGFVITASKDTFVKLWDLSTQHCIQTVVAHRAEVWALDVSPEQDLVFTGSNEGDLKVWNIDHEVLAGGLKEENGKFPQAILPAATLPLSTQHRVHQIAHHPSLSYLAIQSQDRSVEVFRIRTEEEIRKKQVRRRKRAKEKGKEVEEEGGGGEGKVELVDRFMPYVIVRATGKIRSFCFPEERVEAKGGAPICLALSNNAVEVYTIPPPIKSKETPEATRLYALDLPGHRTDVRTLCLNSDDSLLASASNGSLKIWNMRTTACIRTLECGHAICSAFLPGDRHIAVGTKSGELLLYDLSSSTLVETYKAHTGTLWSIHVRHDEQALVTGSADKDVKFWSFERKKPEDKNGPDMLKLVHTRTLKMTDDVLSVRYSPSGKLLAVALLDSTVKVFYQDTLKFFLSLYGHKLPVLSMDISHDSKLIVTSSADKNVKIWGLDFGDCHKSLFAHEDSVMQVAFEHKSHYFWSVGKDKMLKYWDGDKARLLRHHGEIWALAASRFGNFVVTGSHDKSIRVWEKLDEPLFLEEERERELEDIYESGLADTLNRDDPPIGAGAGDAGADLQAAEQAEATGVTKQTAETLMAGERIVEALDLADAERAAWTEYENAKKGLSEEQAARMQPPSRNAILAAHEIEPEAWVLRVVEGIPSAALQDALLVLPFGKVISLMGYLNLWAQKARSEWNITLVSQIIFFLLKTHHHQIVANRTLRTTLIPLRRHLRSALLRQKAAMSYNLAALQFIRRHAEAQRTARFYEEEGLDEEKVRKRIEESSKKRKRVNI